MNNEIVEGIPLFEREIFNITKKLSGKAVFNATTAAATVIETEVRVRAKGSIAANVDLFTYEKENGAKSVVTVKESRPGGKAHHAVFLEYGTSKMAAQPFMRPSFEAKKQQAADAFAKRLAEELT